MTIEEDRASVVAPSAEPGQASLEYLVSVGPMIMFAGSLVGRDDTRLDLDYASPNCGRVLGYPPESITSAPGAFFSRVHPDDRPRLVEAARQATRRGTRAQRLEFRLRHLDGSFRWMESTIRDHSADRSRVLGYAVDVTARHRAETAQRQSESRLSAFLDNSTAVISLKDPFGRYQFVNRAFAEIVGADADRIVGSDDFDHWPDAAVMLRDHDRRVLVAQEEMQFEEVLALPDGPHTFLAQKFPLLDDDGVPVAIGTVATDITELTTALGTLAARERVLSSVIGASPDVITILEEDGVIRTTSIAFERIFGHPTRALVDRCLFDVVHADDVDAVREGFTRLARQGEPRTTLRFRAQRADRQWVTIESHAQLMVDDEGRPDGVVMVSRDISDQIALEAALREAKEHAERASSAKSEFLSRVSHELRTPLNAILGFAQLLEVEELGDPGEEFVDQIIRAGDHLLSLINELLDIARIETEQVNLHLEPLSALEALREVAEMAAPLARRDGITLGRPAVAGSGEPSLTVHADRQRLLQVLLNLTSNAIKYNHPGGRVDLCVEPVDDRRVRLSVTDTGRGLEPDQVERLWVPFDRLGLEHSSIEGTGVGLALSRGLAERMGGHLGVRSTPGSGSTFWVELPSGDAPSSTDPHPAPGDHR